MDPSSVMALILGRIFKGSDPSLVIHPFSRRPSSDSVVYLMVSKLLEDDIHKNKVITLRYVNLSK
jgi:hypothetical protein